MYMIMFFSFSHNNLTCIFICEKYAYSLTNNLFFFHFKKSELPQGLRTNNNL